MEEWTDRRGLPRAYLNLQAEFPQGRILDPNVFPLEDCATILANHVRSAEQNIFVLGYDPNLFGKKRVHSAMLEAVSKRNVSLRGFVPSTYLNNGDLRELINAGRVKIVWTPNGIRRGHITVDESRVLSLDPCGDSYSVSLEAADKCLGVHLQRVTTDHYTRGERDLSLPSNRTTGQPLA